MTTKLLLWFLWGSIIGCSFELVILYIICPNYLRITCKLPRVQGSYVDYTASTYTRRVYESTYMDHVGQPTYKNALYTFVGILLLACLSLSVSLCPSLSLSLSTHTHTHTHTHSLTQHTHTHTHSTHTHTHTLTCIHVLYILVQAPKQLLNCMKFSIPVMRACLCTS